ncbi:polysaccharide deacetylase family protein [Pseudonocardia acidicola]|uniref:polysaccharide deacetylase family protein n=1 Tax=Pseudonocardia acidicola TaxID=2724939 RepID=UPI001B7CFC72
MLGTESRHRIVLALIAGPAVVLIAWFVAPEPAEAASAQPSVGQSAVQATVLTTVQGDGRRVALTFDDGPDPTSTPMVLTLLARYDAVGTFCMIGTQVQANLALARRVAAAGMRICSHSRTHDLQLGTRPVSRMTAEITDVGQRLPGITVRYFRAPGGNWTPTLQAAAARNGLQPLGWSVDPQDWRRPGMSAIVTRVEQHVRPGSIILMHDGGGPRDQTVAALGQLLPWLTAQGYGFAFPTP